MLSDLAPSTDPRVLVDFRTADDAGVYVVDEGTALVQTLDFFTPIVDDPEAYGRIAAANALSDVYAMGGRPITALAIAAFPVKGFPAEDMKAIFAGGQSVLESAGVALLGGHTVQDAEVKFGYAITGLVDPRSIWTNAGACTGDVLLLTKPLGSGIITTAAKYDRAPELASRAALETMTSLNREAAEALHSLAPGTVHACTDITGFGFLGHACEMALASAVQLLVDPGRIPILPHVLELATRNRSGGLATNQLHFAPHIERDGELDGNLEAVLYDPQTSGGLLAAVAGDQTDAAERALSRVGVKVARVGEVVSGSPAGVVRLRPTAAARG